MKEPIIIIIDCYDNRRQQLEHVRDTLQLGDQDFVIWERAEGYDPGDVSLRKCVLLSWHMSNADALSSLEEKQRENTIADQLITNDQVGIRMRHTGATINAEVNDNKTEGTWTFRQLLRLVKSWKATNDIPNKSQIGKYIKDFLDDYESLLFRSLVPLDILLQGAILHWKYKKKKVPDPESWFDESKESLRELLEDISGYRQFENKYLVRLGNKTTAMRKHLMNSLFFSIAMSLAEKEKELNLDNLLGDLDKLEEAHNTFVEIANVYQDN